MPEVEFTVEPVTRKLEMHVKGIAGPACEDVARLAGGEGPHATHRVRRAAEADDGGEAHEHRRPRRRILQELGLGQLG